MSALEVVLVSVSAGMLWAVCGAITVGIGRARNRWELWFIYNGEPRPGDPDPVSHVIVGIFWPLVWIYTAGHAGLRYVLLTAERIATPKPKAKIPRAKIVSKEDNTP